MWSAAAILFTTMIAVAVSTDSAGAMQSRFISIANKDCTFAPIGNEPGDAEDQLKACPGLGGAQIMVNALGTRMPVAGDQVLAVIRVAQDTACVIGAVDAGANPKANEMAHALAHAASSFVCGKDKPTIGGAKTKAAEEIVRGIAEQ